jgi:hypothetical protein
MLSHSLNTGMLSRAMRPHTVLRRTISSSSSSSSSCKTLWQSLSTSTLPSTLHHHHHHLNGSITKPSSYRNISVSASHRRSLNKQTLIRSQHTQPQPQREELREDKSSADELTQSMASVIDRLAIDTIHHDWKVVQHIPVPEFNMTVIKLTHTQHPNTHWYHLARADNDNAFVIAFRTPPTDSTGVAHILEHTVLCGSQRYPVRDPFFMLLRRSLNTFMNAMTASDYTMYPVSICQHCFTYYHPMSILAYEIHRAYIIKHTNTYYHLTFTMNGAI